MPLQIRSIEEYNSAYKKSIENPDQFWADEASSYKWQQKWETVQTGTLKECDIKWFKNGKLNITENCLDRFVEIQPDKPAIIFEPNQPEALRCNLSYRELHEEVCKAANMFKDLGVEKGDRVCLYMSMVPELMISVLACARIGAVHSVVFAGFSSKALADRINDSDCKLLITNDGSYRGSRITPLKDISDEALKTCPSIENVLIVKRTWQSINMKDGRDHWWHEKVRFSSKKHTAEIMDSEDPLFILYTSGSTGKPKGVVHTVGGYMVYAGYSFRNVFQMDEDDIYWCTADIGWITGHSYIVYGPLLNGATTVMFEGVPTFPDAGRFWEIVEKHRITHFYTAPTAIRALQACDTKFTKDWDLSSLKVLGSVGEPINEEAWHWYHEEIGKKKCPIVDTWWQTETGGIMISALAGITKEKPSYATLPLPGIQPILVDNDGNEIIGNNVEGNLCIKHPWPSMTRTIYGDHKRYKETYFSQFAPYYFTGDGCRRDEDGYYRITGRVDDVLNVSGHRLGTAEIENAIDEHKNVVETAVVGYPHDIKGQGIYAYMICRETPTDMASFQIEINACIMDIIGPIAKPDKIQIVSGLPKTRSGKIMRRILRKIAEGETSNLGDISTLLDPSVVEEIKRGAK